MWFNAHNTKRALNLELTTVAMLMRFLDPVRGVRVGVRLDDTLYDVTETVGDLADWLRASAGRPQTAIDELEHCARESNRAYMATVVDAPPMDNLPALLPPVDLQEVWGTALNYRRAGNMNGFVLSDPELYAQAQHAERPALFYRAAAHRVVPPYGAAGIRRDSHNTIATPELALLLNPALEVVGATMAIGMTARDIARENPLYLTQATVYSGACVLGPGWRLGKLRAFPELTICLKITRDGELIYEDEANTSAIQRTLPSLIDHLGRIGIHEDGVVLLTGTGIIPPPDFALQPGDAIRVTTEDLGALTVTARVI